jgi:flagellar hook-associated protein 1 FlgK
VIERDDNTIDVIMVGRTLVTREHAEQLEVSWNHDDNGSVMKLLTVDNKREVSLSEGKLAGLLTSRNEQVSGALSQLDALAKLVADKVNELHVQGHNGTTSGVLFFVGDTAHTITVNPALVENPELIATSRSGAAGDNDIAREIADLAQTSLDGEGGATLLDRYRMVIVDLAADRSRFEFLVESQENLVTAVESRLASVRGVNLDEEGANLIRFQHSYEASARVITAVQDMFQALLEM